MKLVPAPLALDLEFDNLIEKHVAPDKVAEIKSLLSKNRVVILFVSESGTLGCGLIDKKLKDLSLYDDIVTNFRSNEILRLTLRLDVQHLCEGVLHMTFPAILSGIVCSLADKRAVLVGKSLSGLVRDGYTVSNTWTSAQIGTFCSEFFSSSELFSRSVSGPALVTETPSTFIVAPSAPKQILTVPMRDEIIRLCNEGGNLGYISQITHSDAKVVESVLQFYAMELHVVKKMGVEDVAKKCGHAETDVIEFPSLCKERFNNAYLQNGKDLEKTKKDLCISDELANYFVSLKPSNNAVVINADADDDDDRAPLQPRKKKLAPTVVDDATNGAQATPIVVCDNDNVAEDPLMFDMIIGYSIERRKAQMQVDHHKEMESLTALERQLTQQFEDRANTIADLTRVIEAAKKESEVIEKQRSSLMKDIEERERSLEDRIKAEERRLVEIAPNARLATRLLADQCAERFLNFADSDKNNNNTGSAPESSKKRPRNTA